MRRVSDDERRLNGSLGEGEVPAGLFGRTLNKSNDRASDIDMNHIVGTHDILFLCLDTLRYDVAAEEAVSRIFPA